MGAIKETTKLTTKRTKTQILKKKKTELKISYTKKKIEKKKIKPKFFVL